MAGHCLVFCLAFCLVFLGIRSNAGFFLTQLNQNENPFQAPSDYSVAPTAALADAADKPISVPKVLAKWTAICCISAAPSFVFGLILAHGRFTEIAGMILGVATFIVAYTVFECSSRFQILIKKRFVRYAARIGYGMRLLISVVFPLGAYIDIPTGMLSVTITSFICGRDVSQIESSLMSLAWFYSTTLVQGFLLNVILLVFMTAVYGLAVLFSGRK